ncbi:uncharacterized protein L201_000524 [Kwoniella dendrophila CBS 6074]|uniref:Mannosyltransferase n=1 Tax=Kwoniella dendrophila CBS 6074 TaxID=1295534 RepID=A0AAX4JLF7_9TREE
MIPSAFLVALTIRLLLTLPFPQTYFQPDEFYQALEPAHNFIYGYGYLTWEWKDLPCIPTGNFWDLYVVGGRMRSWLWHSLFAGVYKLLEISNLDKTELIVIAPRLIGVMVAALTDYYTYKLASKIISPGASTSALFLSLTSLFNAHLLPRSLSTSPETLLTTMALCYFPFPHCTPSTKSSQRTDLANSMDSKGEKEATRKSLGVSDQTNKLDYVAMDRDIPQELVTVSCTDNLPLAVMLATLALCIRPTTAPLWAYLGVNLLINTWRISGFSATAKTILTASVSLLFTFVASTALDYCLTGRLYFPSLTFIHHNLIQNISAFYGSTNYLYHITQSIPILLFPIWYWWIQGFISALLPLSILPKSLQHLDRPGSSRLLGRAITFSIGILSLSPHSEWRFLHPFLPSLLLFAIPAITYPYQPTIFGAYRMKHAFRQYLRIPNFPFYFILVAPVIPFLYLNIFHGRAQVEVMNVLRRGELSHIQSLVALTPCHSVPWQSHLHNKDIDGWFLTCEPPIGVDSETHRTQQSFFYQSPVSYLQEVFPYPPAQLSDIANITASPAKPSHLIIFGELLDRSEIIQEKQITVRDSLVGLGYKQVWYGWNGFDLLQDEDERKGGLTVWRSIT